MQKDKRKSRRQPIRYTAWISSEGGALRGCALADVSDTGARLDVEDSSALPERFELLLSQAKSAPRRYCHVIWRKEKQIGVNFEHQLTASEQASAVPKARTPEPAESA